MIHPARSALLLLAVGLLAGCSSDSQDSPGAGASASAGCPIVASDTWVKAAESGMTGAFGSLANQGGEAVTVVSASSDAAGRVEIHEVVDQDGTAVMRPKEGGLAIPAGGAVTLEPGADHIMLMDIDAPIKAGDSVGITLECSNGTTASFSGIAKPFEGAKESYAPGAASPMGTDGISPSASGSMGASASPSGSAK